MARPMPKENEEINLENECSPEQQQKFQFCVQPLSAFQRVNFFSIKKKFSKNF